MCLFLRYRKSNISSKQWSEGMNAQIIDKWRRITLSYCSNLSSIGHPDIPDLIPHRHDIPVAMAHERPDPISNIRKLSNCVCLLNIWCWSRTYIRVPIVKRPLTTYFTAVFLVTNMYVGRLDRFSNIIYYKWSEIICTYICRPFTKSIISLLNQYNNNLAGYIII